MDCALWRNVTNRGNQYFPHNTKKWVNFFLSHLAFGAAKMAIAVNIGDNRLFKLKNLVIELEDQKDDRGTELSFDL